MGSPLFFVVGLLVLLFPNPSNSKFLTSFEIKSQLPLVPSQTIYWNGKLHVTYDVFNGPERGARPTLVRYDSKGNKELEYTIPLACYSLSCLVRIESVFLTKPETKNPILILNLVADASTSNFRWSLIGFDLGSWTLKSSIADTEKRYELVPFADDSSYSTAILQSTLFDSRISVLEQFDLNTFKKSGGSPVNVKAVNVISPLGVLRNQSVYACADFEDRYQFVSVDFKTGSALGFRDYRRPLYFMGGANPLAPAAQPLLSISEYNYRTMKLSVTPLDNPDVVLSHYSIDDGYSANFITDGSNAFLLSWVTSNQTRVRLQQFSYGSNRLVLLDTIELPPHLRPNFNREYRAVTYSASYPIQQLALPLISSEIRDTVWVISYDGQHKMEQGSTQKEME